LRFVDITLLILSASLGLFLALFIVRNRRAPGSQALSLLILGASIWSLAYAFELLASSLAIKLFWERVEFFGIVVIPLAWFTFVAQYLGYPQWMKRTLEQRVLLGIIPIVTLILVWTNDLHNLVWQKVELESVGPFIMLDFTRGPWFWVLMVFSYTLLLLGSVALVMSLFNIVRLQRWQVILALLAILLPWIGNILYITGISPEHFLDWTAFLFLISGVLFSISLFRFQLVNILPIAQETVFAGLTDCVIVVDMSDKIVESNPMAKKMISCLGDESLGKNLAEMIPELDEHVKKAGLAREYNTEFAQGEGEDSEYYDLHISLLSDPYTNPIGHVVVLHQITKFKQDQAELVRARDQLELVVSERTDELRRAIGLLQEELVQRTLAEKRFKDVVESAPDAMFVLDQSGEILLINAMAERLFGYPREELVGMNITSNLIPVRYREREGLYFQEFLGSPSINQSSFGVDLYAMRKDGSEFPMEVDLSRLDTTSGYWVAINIRDISERVRVETALRESERTYRALFENAGDAIILTDMEGRIMQVNQKSVELLGYTRAELKALSILDITVQEEIIDVKRNLERLKNGNRLMPYVRHYLKKSGEVLSTENNTVLVTDAEGKPMFFQNISRDISERIKAEQAQQQLLEEIRKSNEQMRELAFRLQEVQELERRELATVLHDRVGQNLTGLNLNLKILQNHLRLDDEAEIQKRLNDSLMIVEETTHQIRDVMADLNPPVLDEYGLMAAIKWYSGDFSNRTGIATQVSGDKGDLDLEPRVEKILFRLVQESLNNVAKHAQASRAEIGVKINSDMVRLTVKDNGQGFDSHRIDRFESEPHWGLLSMQQRATSIGAELVVDSSIGAGTEVSVTLRRNHGD
jgi:PAS domain S-box-containing protein